MSQQVSDRILALKSEEATEQAVDRVIIDCDVHERPRSWKELLPYLPRQWHSYLTDGGFTGFSKLPYVVPTAGGGQRTDAAPSGASGPPVQTAGTVLETLRKQHLDEYGVRYAVLTGGWLNPGMAVGQTQFASAMASAYNDWVIDHWLSKDERLKGTIQIVPQDPIGAAREIDRVGPHPSMVQIMLPVLSNTGYGLPLYRPIFEAATRHELVIGMHQCPITSTAIGWPAYFVEWHTCMPQGFMSQMVSLICGGVFEDFPEMRVVLIEGGFTWVPYLMWRLDSQWSYLRSEVPWVQRKPSETIRENFRCTTQPMDEADDDQKMLAMIDMIGSDEFLLFSSDYPHWDFDSPVQALPRGLDEQLRRRIFGLNAAETYQLVV